MITQSAHTSHLAHKAAMPSMITERAYLAHTTTYDHWHASLGHSTNLHIGAYKKCILLP